MAPVVIPVILSRTDKLLSKSSFRNYGQHKGRYYQVISLMGWEYFGYYFYQIQKHEERKCLLQLRQSSRKVKEI